MNDSDPDTQNTNNTNRPAGARMDSGEEMNDSGEETKKEGKEPQNEDPKAGLKAGTSSGFFAWVGPALRNPRLLKT
jgi:hypothetical protein